MSAASMSRCHSSCVGTPGGEVVDASEKPKPGNDGTITVNEGPGSP
jgi:hypothetical protein